MSETSVPTKKRPAYWEYRLTAELLEQGLAPLLVKYKELSHHPLKPAAPDIDGKYVPEWCQDKIEELSNILESLKKIFEVETIDAWGASGVPGDEKKIRRASSRALVEGRKILEWEEEVRFSRLPPEFKELQKLFEGVAGDMLIEISTFPKQIIEIFGGSNLGGTYNLKLSLRIPDKFLDNLMSFLEDASINYQFRRYSELLPPLTEEQKILVKKIKPVIRSHIPTLSRKYKQLVYEDEYGDMIYANWNREIDKYITRKIAPIIPFISPESQDWSTIERVIMDAILDYEAANELENNDLDDITDPLEYERGVADRLKILGWNARVTPGSGDQGVDVVANKAGKCLVIQCKLYSYPVGNKAVQEVYAAKQYEKADFAAVITNASFTASARQLASSTGVILLHHEDLVQLDNLLDLR
jgi:hypothetical protein